MSDNERTRELLDRYFDRGLDAEEKAELERFLRSSDDARAQFWDRARLHSALRNLAQRRRGERLAKELQASAGPSPITSLPAPPRKHYFTVRGILAMAATLVAAALATWMWYQSVPVGRVTDVARAEWGGKGLKRGDIVSRGSLSLTRGVAQIEFFNGAKLVLEGPIQVRITDQKNIRLKRGRMSAEIPPAGHGFAVETPEGRVVDLGTRFGVNVESSGATDVHVFEGAVNLNTPKRSMKLTTGAAIAAVKGQLTPTSADPLRFPRPTSVLNDLLKDMDFEPNSRIEAGGMPTEPGGWKGDTDQIAGPTANITPKTGSGMLTFNLVGDQTLNQWQSVDLTDVKRAAPGSPVEARFSAYVNRARGAVSQGTFAVTIAAFRGARERTPALWARRSQEAVALHQQTLTADLNPATWERMSAHIMVPPSADFLLVHIAANWPKDPLANGTNYLHLSANNELTLSPRLRRKSLTSDVEANALNGAVLGHLGHHVVTYDANAYEWRWYRNGTIAATLLDNDGVATLDDVNNWVGRSQYNSNSNFEGTFHEFRIYDYALSPEQVLTNQGAGPNFVRITPEPKHHWVFNGPPGRAIPSGSVLPDRVGGATATLLGEGAVFDASGDGVTLPGGSPITQAYIDLPNGVATGTYGGGKRFTSVSYEFWALQNGNRTWSRYFDFGTGTAGELNGPGFPPVGHFADAAVLEIQLPPQASNR